MNFTAVHKEILDRSRPYYDELKTNGTLTKVSSVTVELFVKIYNEAIGPKKFNLWCSACIIELIELVYINYDKYLDDERRHEAGKDAAIPKPNDKGPQVPDPRSISGQDKRVFRKP